MAYFIHIIGVVQVFRQCMCKHVCYICVHLSLRILCVCANRESACMCVCALLLCVCVHTCWLLQTLMHIVFSHTYWHGVVAP